MLQQTDERTLKLHVAPGGCVWYAAGVAAPRDSGQTVDEFLVSRVLSGRRARVRLLGVAAHADFILGLYLRLRSNQIESLELAGPNICETRAELSDPILALHRLRACTLPAAVGGWHPITAAEQMMYVLIEQLRKTNATSALSSRLQLHAFPAYKALSFVPTLSDQHLGELLTTVVDPRWFVDRRFPDRQGKLDLFMGLTPASQKRVSAGDTVLYRSRDLRCSLVLATWKTADIAAVDLDDPRNFLYRIYNAAKGGWRGDLRAGQAFLRYLRYNWLESLEQRPGTKDRLFAPDWFFKSPAEIEGYLKHTAE